MNFNKWIGAGNLTNDPEIKTLESGVPVANFDLAVNEEYKGKTTTLFISCSAFGKTAGIIAKYLRKGNGILVEGKLVLNTWTGRDNQKHSQIKVNVFMFQFVDGGEQTTEPEQSQNHDAHDEITCHFGGSSDSDLPF